MDFNSIFLNKMKILLRDDYPQFLESYQQPPTRGVRVNTLLGDVSQFLKYSNLKLSPIPHCPEGFYLEQGEGIGHLPHHHAGAFYVQEPSAMTAVLALDPQPGETVLDLCAAPGGKSTQIAARMQGKGVLITNEYVANRAKILLSNIERMGIQNAVVTNAHPEQLCQQLDGMCDRVLVDAPCSGEGMFRKDANAIAEWTPEHSLSCANRQLEILESAKRAVKPGGVLVYSTCTFSLEENEMVVCEFLDRNPDFSLEQVPACIGQPSRQNWLDVPYDLSKMHRVFPHQGGEGHFVARLRKEGESSFSLQPSAKSQDIPLFAQFWEETFQDTLPDTVVLNRDMVSILPTQMPVLHRVKVLRAGVLAGRVVKNRFVPEHHLMKCPYHLKAEKCLNLSSKDERVFQYLKGMEISCAPEQKGYCGIWVDDYPLGLGKASNGRMKNHYPKGLREFS